MTSSGRSARDCLRRSRASRRCGCARRRPPAAPPGGRSTTPSNRRAALTAPGCRSANESRSRPCWARARWTSSPRAARSTPPRAPRRPVPLLPRSPWPRPSRPKRSPASLTAPCSFRAARPLSRATRWRGSIDAPGRGASPRERPRSCGSPSRAGCWPPALRPRSRHPRETDLMRPNRLRELLRARKPSLGTHIHSAWPATVELAGHSGMFDYVEFAGEYAPYDLFALENLARAVDTFPHLSAMMKIEQQPRTFVAVRAIGSGIQNLLFADPRTPEDVAECVAAVRAEAPGHGGIHGVGMRRDVGSPAFVQALDDAVVAIMIEKAPAVESLEALLAVKGVDMVQFGPADYSMSIGLAGQWDHPRVVEAERRMIRTALAAGIARRAEISRPEQAKPYLDLGVRHFCLGWDVEILFEWFKREGDTMRKILEDR